LRVREGALHDYVSELPRFELGNSTAGLTCTTLHLVVSCSTLNFLRLLQLRATLVCLLTPLVGDDCCD